MGFAVTLVVYKPEEVAVQLGVSTRTVVSLCGSGAIRARKIGQVWRIPAWLFKDPGETLVAAARGRSRVYFIEAEGLGLVKIGVTINVRMRMRALQYMSPAKLTLAAKLPGSRVLESWLHTRFASERSHGEWFRKTAELDEYIQCLLAVAKGAA